MDGDLDPFINAYLRRNQLIGGPSDVHTCFEFAKSINWKRYFMLTLGVFIMAAGYYFFIIPSGLVTGGANRRRHHPPSLFRRYSRFPFSR
ncbi:MAG: hypothetical protein MZU97_19305 [Bacillus subtilis]|nr:hypothetical protein [Bacillus subtilis]